VESVGVVNIIRWDIYLFIFRLVSTFKQSRRIFYILVKFDSIFPTSVFFFFFFLNPKEEA
jgi:hypothetical protein